MKQATPCFAVDLFIYYVDLFIYFAVELFKLITAIKRMEVIFSTVWTTLFYIFFLYTSEKYLNLNQWVK